MFDEGQAVPRQRAAVLVLCTLLAAVGLGVWVYLATRFYAEAPIVAFGPAAPQMERLTASLVAYFAVGALLLFLTAWLGWLAGREVLRGRRKREAERLLEN
ncbi:MAG: hypothetical protein ACM3XZ_08155 [Betaproteobacteria bacterium]